MVGSNSEGGPGVAKYEALLRMNQRREHIEKPSKCGTNGEQKAQENIATTASTIIATSASTIIPAFADCALITRV